MRALGDRLFGLCCLGLALACACSVFPDSAVLPIAEGQGGSAGEPSPEGGAPIGEAGQGGSAIPNGGSTLGGTGGDGSATGGAGSAGVNIAEAGAAGQGTGGTGVTCAAPQVVRVPVKADLWIGEANPGDKHEGEPLVYVSASADDERRTLLALEVPGTPGGAVLSKAELVMPLVSNADASKSPRSLALRLVGPHEAANTPDPKQVTWTNYDSGAKRVWYAPGIELGAVVAEAQIGTGTTSGRVTFEITQATRGVLKPTAQTVPVILVESGSAPSAPAALAFTSLEGNASGSAALELTYCEP